MIDQVPHTDALDAFLRDVVQTLHSAVNQGIRAAGEDPAVTDRAIADCTEIIMTVMAGRVQEWVG